METEHDRILNLLRRGDYLLTFHARERARERSVTAADFRALGRSGTVFYEKEAPKLRVVGFDLDGDPLTAVIVLTHDLVIITVF